MVTSWTLHRACSLKMSPVGAAIQMSTASHAHVCMVEGALGRGGKATSVAVIHAILEIPAHLVSTL